MAGGIFLAVSVTLGMQAETPDSSMSAILPTVHNNQK